MKFEYLENEKFVKTALPLFKIFYHNMQAVAELSSDFDSEYLDWYNAVKEGLQAPQRKIVLIKDNDCLIGFFQYYANNGVFCMEEIQFVPEYQSKGIFRGLYRFLIANLPSDTEKVLAFTHLNNDRSIKILGRLGLSRVSVVNDKYYRFEGNYSSLLDWLSRGVTLRIAEESDAEAIASVYRYYVEETPISFEYTAPDEKEFSERISHKKENYPFIIAERDGKVIGYAYASRLRERAAYDWDAELSVYLDKNELAKGIGSRLYSAITEILKMQNIVTLYAGVTDPNPESVALHEKFGFVLAGRSKAVGFKQGVWYDVLWYEKLIGELTVPKPFIPFPKLDRSEVESILKNTI